MRRASRLFGQLLGAGFVAVALVLAAAAPASAASAPTVVTGPASAIGLTSATVSGNVNPNGTSTSWYFEYGTSTTYGSSTPKQGLSASSSSAAVSIQITGLTPGTTYHYRLVAESSAGTVPGKDATFTSLADRPEVVTRAASAVGSTTAQLNGTVNPNGLATAWHFRYGTTTKYGSSTASVNAGSGVSPVVAAQKLANLVPGTTYHFQLVAKNAVGASYGSDLTFKVTGSSPSVVTNAVSDIGPTSAQLNGTVNPNGLATTWRFRYGKSTHYGDWTSSETAGSGQSVLPENEQLTHLVPDTTYHVQMVAKNAIGTSYGADRSFVTAGPPRPTTGPATDVGATSATLTGSVDPDGQPTTWYYQYGTGTNYGSTTPPRQLGAASTALSAPASIGDLRPATTYHFRLVATNSSGTRYGDDASFATPGPTLSASRLRVVHGRFVVLHGALPPGEGNAKVAILEEPITARSFVGIATVVTNADGTWALRVRPRIRTTYAASWDGVTRTVTIRVAPSVWYRTAPVGRIITHVVESQRLQGHLVRLQRLIDGRWRTIAAARLNARSSATFHPRLPRGLSRLRVFLTGYQAGPGYLAGYSAVHLYRRR